MLKVTLESIEPSTSLQDAMERLRTYAVPALNSLGTNYYTRQVEALAESVRQIEKQYKARLVLPPTPHEPIYRDAAGHPYTVRGGVSVWVPENVLQATDGRLYVIRSGTSMWLTPDEEMRVVSFGAAEQAGLLPGPLGNAKREPE
jgi:hypothetical protein